MIPMIECVLSSSDESDFFVVQERQRQERKDLYENTNNLNDDTDLVNRDTKSDVCHPPSATLKWMIYFGAFFSTHFWLR